MIEGKDTPVNWCEQCPERRRTTGIRKLSDGDPTVLAIGLYGEPQLGFDSVLGTKLIDELKKNDVGVYHVHPLETNYDDMPEVDFAISLGPPGRARMLGEDFQECDRGTTSFIQTVMNRTKIARVILQEWPWHIPPKIELRSLKSPVLNFSFGPMSKMEPWPEQWGQGWFYYRGVYWLYPFADKEKNHPGRKRDFVVLDCPDPNNSNWDFSEHIVKVLDELGVDYFQAARDFKDRIPYEDFAEKLNQAKLYFQVKAESYSMTAIEAVASEAIVLGTFFTFRKVYSDEFKFTMMPDTNYVTLRKAVTMGLDVYDDPEIKERLRRMREKLWDYKRLAWEISDAMKKLKYGWRGVK